MMLVILPRQFRKLTRRRRPMTDGYDYRAHLTPGSALSRVIKLSEREIC